MKDSAPLGFTWPDKFKINLDDVKAMAQQNVCIHSHERIPKGCFNCKMDKAGTPERAREYK